MPFDIGKFKDSYSKFVIEYRDDPKLYIKLMKYGKEGKIDVIHPYGKPLECNGCADCGDAIIVFIPTKWAFTALYGNEEPNWE